MIDMRRFHSVLLGLLLSAPPTMLAAQAIQSPYQFIETRHTVSGYAGFLTTNTGRLDLGPQSAPIVGARYNYHFSGPLYGEAGLSFAPSNRTIYSAPRTNPTAIEAVGETSALLMFGEAGLKFNLTGPRTWYKLAPYAVTTLGLAVDLSGTAPEERDLEIEQLVDFGPAFAVSLGLGGNYFLSERLSIRAEARDYLWRLASPPGFSPTGARVTEWTNNFAFSLGASFHF
jgi:hypothetical protein